MTMRKGERYACEDPACGCEIEVVRSATPDARATMEMRAGEHPRCTCGHEMQPLDGGSTFDPAGATL